MSGKINLMANVVMPVITLLTTIALAFLFQPEECGTLFYFNLCYILFLECIFFGWLSFLRSGTQEVSTVFRIVTGVMAIYYVIIGASIMLVYSLILSHWVGIKWYIAVLFVLTLLWFILATLIAQADANQQKNRNK